MSYVFVAQNAVGTLIVGTYYASSPATVSTSGGLTLGGSANVAVGLPVLPCYEPAVTVGDAIVGSGGAGTHCIYTVTASGGLTLGGSSSVAANRAYVGSGSLTLVGTYAYTLTKRYPTNTTGVAISGVGTTIRHAGYIGSGGLVVSDGPSYKRTIIASVSSGITVDGTVRVGRVVVALGGLTIGGSVSGVINHGYTGTGGLSISGTSALVIKRVPSPSSGLILGGTATEVARVGTHEYTPAGGVLVSGIATNSRRVTISGSGGETLGGTSSVVIRRGYIASSGVSISGTSALVKRTQLIVTGNVQIAGSSGRSIRKKYATIPNNLLARGTINPIFIIAPIVVGTIYTTDIGGALNIGGFALYKEAILAKDRLRVPLTMAHGRVRLGLPGGTTALDANERYDATAHGH